MDRALSRREEAFLEENQTGETSLEDGKKAEQSGESSDWTVTKVEPLCRLATYAGLLWRWLKIRTGFWQLE